MADVEAPATEQDQPVTPEAPETDQPTGGEESFTDSYNPAELPEEARGAYEEAYKRLQGAYTQKTQTLAEERREADQARQMMAALQNPQTRAAVLQQFGIEMVEDDEDELPDEEPDLYDRLERVEGQLTQREQAERQAQFENEVVNHVVDEIAALEKSEQRELSPDHHQAIDILARARQTAEGYPDVKWAYDLLSGISKADVKAFVESKKAPRRPANGTPASQAADLSNPETRRQRMAEAADAARDSS